MLCDPLNIRNNVLVVFAFECITAESEKLFETALDFTRVRVNKKLERELSHAGQRTREYDRADNAVVHTHIQNECFLLQKPTLKSHLYRMENCGIKGTFCAFVCDIRDRCVYNLHPCNYLSLNEGKKTLFFCAVHCELSVRKRWEKSHSISNRSK